MGVCPFVSASSNWKYQLSIAFHVFKKIREHVKVMLKNIAIRCFYFKIGLTKLNVIHTRRRKLTFSDLDWHIYCLKYL